MGRDPAVPACGIEETDSSLRFGSPKHDLMVWTTKMTKRVAKIAKIATFRLVRWFKVSKAASIFYRNRPVSAFWIHEMRSSKGRIDHPSLGRFPLAGASGTPKMLPIWIISRVGETDLRAFSPISRVWDPRIGPFWGKGSLHFLPLARN